VSAPVAPYATSAQVAVLLTNLLKGGTDFDTNTTPTKTKVDTVIGWVSSQVDMQFGAAGYKIPFAAVSGETWPTSQTYYLSLVTCLGASAYVGGHVLKPAPAVAPGKEGGTGNLFQDLFDKHLGRIFDGTRTSLAFRADYYAGTPAEKALTQPSGPGLDFMENYFDSTSYMNLWDFTQSMQEVQDYVKELGINWNYLFTYANINVGLGV
jgi:hypothetical protein